MNSKQRNLTPCIILCVTALLTVAGCAQKHGAAPPEPKSVQAEPMQAVTEPVEAKDILLRMASFLATTPRFSVNVQDNYDVVQASGQKIEFGENRKVVVSRPDHLRVESERSDGDKHVMLYDGKTITVFTPSQNVYAQTEKPGGIDEAIVYFLRDLHMRLPLAAVLLSRFPQELENRTQSIEYVEKTNVQGKPAHHLAGRTDTVDYQVWIAQGAQPLLLKAVLTYRNAEGQPQFRADFSDWNLSPQIQDAGFAFTPPQGAEKISFLAQVPQQFEIPGAKAPKPKGGKK